MNVEDIRHGMTVHVDQVRPGFEGRKAVRGDSGKVVSVLSMTSDEVEVQVEIAGKGTLSFYADELSATRPGRAQWIMEGDVEGTIRESIINNLGIDLPTKPPKKSSPLGDFGTRKLDGGEDDKD